MHRDAKAADTSLPSSSPWRSPREMREFFCDLTVTVETTPANTANLLRATGHAGIDTDPDETREWLEALEAVVQVAGHDRALTLLRLLEEQAQQRGIVATCRPTRRIATRFPREQRRRLSGRPRDRGATDVDHALERARDGRARERRRTASSAATSASYASAAEIFEIGFNHFFRADEGRGGDLVFFQPHSAPGVYARAFLEGRLTDEHLANYRQEVGGRGLSSYPHPWLMPDFWQFPRARWASARSARSTRRASCAISSIAALPIRDRRVWGVFGDGAPAAERQKRGKEPAARPAGMVDEREVDARPAVDRRDPVLPDAAGLADVARRDREGDEPGSQA